MNKKILNLPIGETQVGLKAFSQQGKQAVLKSTINGYLFDIEVLKIGVKNNLSIALSEVSLRHNIAFTTMGLKTLFREFVNYLIIVFTR